MNIQNTFMAPGSLKLARRLGPALLACLFASPLAAAPAAVEIDGISRDAKPEQITPSKTLKSSASPYWLGPDQQPLPFSTDSEIVDFLSSATVVKKKQLNSGSTKPWKFLLEKDGIQANAIFRTVSFSQGKGHRSFEDNHIFEVAAYETARLLGLTNVPPAVRRVFGNQEGSLQLWVEGAQSETERIEQGDDRISTSSMIFQKHSMRVFDHLIHNFDRNTGNLLIDDNGKLWLVDHTRAFRAKTSFPEGPEVTLCERELWQRLSTLDRKVLKKSLAALLSPRQLASLLKRHQKLVKHLQTLIEQRGEDGVLFDEA